MSLETYCSNPTCGRRYVFPTGSAGRSVRCNACGQTFIAGGATVVNVPRTPAASPPLAPAPAPNPSRSTPASAPVLASDSVEPMSLSPDSMVSGQVNVTLASTLDTSLGRFVVRDRLGAGAFGTVYRAYDPHLEREVALKVPNPGAIDTPKRVERFLREAKAAARLRHPHIVPVYDAGQDGDRYYIASAFVDGQPLAEAIPDGGMDFERAVRITRELAEALGYAHGQGIVHRDVKPANIMIDKHDSVHLMDFGLAARHDEEAKLTADGAVLGTACYMAPEQAAGQKGEAQPAVDQYAVGVVLYELLTGHTPFTGPLAVVIHNVINNEPDPPRKFRADVPADLETICLKAMAKNPENRYLDCQDLADDLRRWQEGEPVAARPLQAWERAVQRVQKEWKLVALVLVLLVSLIAIVILSRRADSARQQSVIATREASEATEAARKRSDEATSEVQRAEARTNEERKKAAGLQTQLENERKKAEAFQVKVLTLQPEGEIIPARLVGTWKKVGQERTLEFTKDGKYVVTKDVRVEGTYKVTDSTLTHTLGSTDTTIPVSATITKLTDDGMLLKTDGGETITYLRVKP